jgi:WD40 repeat protein
LAAGGKDLTIRLWETDGWRQRAALAGHTHWINALRFSPDGKTLASSTGDRWPNVPGELKLWDAASGHIRATFVGRSSPLAMTSDGNTLIVGSNSGTLLLLEAAEPLSADEAPKTGP